MYTNEEAKDIFFAPKPSTGMSAADNASPNADNNASPNAGNNIYAGNNIERDTLASVGLEN